MKNNAFCLTRTIARFTAEEITEEIERRANIDYPKALEWVKEYIADANRRGGMAWIEGTENEYFWPDDASWGYDPEKGLIVIAGQHQEGGEELTEAVLYVALKHRYINVKNGAPIFYKPFQVIEMWCEERREVATEKAKG